MKTEDHEKIENINDINLAPMKRYIIEYRNEFSAVVEAENSEDAIAKVQTNPDNYQWELVGDLHPCFFEDVTDELL